jgi:hypothetical protein
MLKVMQVSVVCILTILFEANCFAYAQKTAAISQREDLPARQLENVRIEAQSIGSLFSDLSLNYDIPIGLEVTANEDELTTYQLNLKEGTLSDLLTQFTARHDRYAWEIRDGVVNVFPKDGYRDALSRDLLETKIGRFAVKENTSCWDLVRSLVATPEIKQVLQAHGTRYRMNDFSGAYIPQVGREFKLDVSDMALKPLLNKVIGTSPTARFWLVTRNSHDQTIFLNLNARHEGLPPNVTSPAVLQLDR